MKNKKIIIAICAVTLTLTAGVSSVYASEQSKKDSLPQADEIATLKDSDSTLTVLEDEIRQPEKIDGNSLSKDSYFMSKEEYEATSSESIQCPDYTEDELNAIIKEIESGKIKPFNPADLAEDSTAWFTDSEGNQTIIK